MTPTPATLATSASVGMAPEYRHFQLTVTDAVSCLSEAQMRFQPALEKSFRIAYGQTR